MDGVKKIDWAGIFTIVCSTLMLLIGLQMGGTSAPWTSALVILLIIFGIIGFGVFVLVEWKVSKSPLMPLRFFKHRASLAILGVNISQSFITTGVTYFIPLYFQLVLKASPIMSGVYFLPTSVVLAICFVFVGYMLKRTGEYKLMIQLGAGAILLGTGLFIHLRSYPDWPLIILTQILVAIGLGFAYQAPLIAFHAQIEDTDVAAGTSLFQFLKTLSQTTSVIIGQVILQSQIEQQSHLLENANLPESLMSSLSSGNAFATSLVISQFTSSQQEVIRSVLTNSFDRMWIFYTVVAFLGLVSSFGITRIKL
jgi:hypothetical protein